MRIWRVGWSVFYFNKRQSYIFPWIKSNTERTVSVKTIEFISTDVAWHMNKSLNCCHGNKCVGLMHAFSAIGFWLMALTKQSEGEETLRQAWGQRWPGRGTRTLPHAFAGKVKCGWNRSCQVSGKVRTGDLAPNAQCENRKWKDRRLNMNRVGTLFCLRVWFVCALGWMVWRMRIVLFRL